MGTTQNTSGSNQSNLQFNPAAQSQYNNLITGGGNQLSQMINNPFGNALYQLGLGQSQKGASQQGANNMGALNQNQKVQGLGGQAGQGWLAAQRAMTGRANSSMMSQANVGNVMNALQRQMQATGMGMSFSPQLTGQTGNFNQQTSMSGLGTWLPQLMSGVANAGMNLATGGMGGLGAAMTQTGAGSGGGYAAPSTTQGGGIGGAGSSFTGFGAAPPSAGGGFNPILSMMMSGAM